MPLSKLDNLYRKVILDHFSHPHHRGALLTKSTRKIELNNQTCGDIIELYVEVKDEIIKDISFDGRGCSISIASASMMTDIVFGKTVEVVKHLMVDFSDLVQGKEVMEIDHLGDAAMLSGVSKFPARIKCAILAWKALGKAVEEDSNVVFHHDYKEQE